MKYLNVHLCLVVSMLNAITTLEALSSWGNKLDKMMNDRVGKKPGPGANKDTIGPRHQNNSPRRPINNDDAGYTMSETQARNYIDQCIAAFDFSLRPAILDSELRDLAHCIKDSVERGSNTYHYTSSGKKYNKDKIDQYINGGILSYIEQASYDYALEQTNNGTVARKIAESMRNNALARIQRNSNLDAEILTTFIGNSLRRAVREAINRFEVPSQQNYNRPTASAYNSTPSQPNAASAHAQNVTASSAESSSDRTFPTPECPICYESFETTNRLFLAPCGHNMCKTCAYNWCFTNSNNSCPLCRADINRQKLAEKF